MNDLQKRTLLFLIGCMGSRFGLVWLAKNRQDYLPLLGSFAILLSIGFMTIFLFDLRKTGAEVFGARIWWNTIRPLHSLLWGLFAYLALTDNPNAWIVLLIDTLIGLTAFTMNRLS